MTLMERRRALMAAKKTRLPTGYQEVEWIGYDYTNLLLNTNVSGSIAAKIKVKLSKLSVLSQNTVFPCAFSGDTFINVPYNFMETGTIYSITPTVARTDTFDAKNFELNRASAFAYNIGLGYQNGWCPKMRYWQLAFYDESNNLVSLQVPCYRKSDGAPGLYDVTNGRFNEAMPKGITKWLIGNDVQ